MTARPETPAWWRQPADRGGAAAGEPVAGWQDRRQGASEYVPRMGTASGGPLYTRPEGACPLCHDPLPHYCGVGRQVLGAKLAADSARHTDWRKRPRVME